MYTIIKLFTFLLLTFCLGCSSNSTKTTENPEDAAVVEEIQALDSVSQILDKNTQEIEATINSAESALDALNDF